MAGFLVVRREIGVGRPGTDLPVARVARLEDQLLARRNLDDRRDVGMPAIVAGMRFFLETLPAVDPDLFDGNLR
jgi:hypothetical protein